MLYRTCNPRRLRGGKISPMKILRRMRKFGTPIVSDVLRHLGIQFLPALGSLGQDYLTQKGINSNVGDLLATASVKGSEALAKSKTKSSSDIQKNIADLVSQRSQDLLAKRMSGRGPRPWGGNSILGSGSFSALSTSRNLG